MLRKAFIGTVVLCMAFACSSEDDTGSGPNDDCMGPSECASTGGEGGAGGNEGQDPSKCKTDAECSDGEFCNGEETCAPEDAEANSKGCLVSTSTPCTGQACDEAADACLSCDDGDVDKDGHKAIACDGDDCDDNDKARFPGNEEVCDDAGHDEDCDYETLGGPKDADVDKDDFVAVACCNTQKNGDLLCGTDCDDSKQGINPGQEEACNGIDDDCDGVVDGETEDDDLKTTFYVDKDGDDFGDPSSETRACVQPDVGWILNSGDCQDDPDLEPLASNIRPDAQEKCNGIDDDCDGEVDSDDASLEAAPTNPGTTYVCDGSWKITECPANTLHCDTNVENGCEVDATTLSNCRRCDNQCLLACGATDCIEVTAVAAGYNHSCAITSDGKAACWGQNTDGRLGDTTTTQRLAPRTVGGGLSNVTALSLGATHSCAIANPSSTLYCWGSNANGRLGNSTLGASTATPTPVNAPSGGGNLTNVVSVAAGFAHTCAVLASGQAVCWGEGDHGRLGGGPLGGTGPTWPDQGPTAVVRSGTLLALSNAKRIVAGTAHTCALTTANTVECWGDNSSGQLGAGVLPADPEDTCATSFSTPCASYSYVVTGLTSVLQLAAGAYHTCALVSDGTGDGDANDGTVVCWGANGSRQLGLSSGTSYNTPQPVSGLSNVKALAAGTTGTCALLTNGDVQCWGSNEYFQRGDAATATATHARTTIALTEDAQSIAANLSHVCALGASGQVWCWGYNVQGQLGNSTTDADGTQQPQELSPLN